MYICELTFFRRSKGIVSRHVLDIVHHRSVGQEDLLLVDLVHGVLERKLRRAVLLVLREYCTWSRKRKGSGE